MGVRRLPTGVVVAPGIGWSASRTVTEREASSFGAR
jgi:hypothetical protein